ARALRPRGAEPPDLGEYAARGPRRRAATLPRQRGAAADLRLPQRHRPAERRLGHLRHGYPGDALPHAEPLGARLSRPARSLDMPELMAAWQIVWREDGHLDEGWLVIFDLRSTSPWEERLSTRLLEANGKRVHVVGC